MTKIIVFLFISVFTNIGTAHAWESFEERLIQAGCWHYAEEEPVNQKFIRCLHVDLTNIEPGQIDRVTHLKGSILGCARNSDSRWCEVSLINNLNKAVLFVSIEKGHSKSYENYNSLSIVVNEFALGDTCSCKVTEWGIETDYSTFYNWGGVNDKEAMPILDALRKANALSIYATIPNKFKANYRVDMKNLDIMDFKHQIESAIQFVNTGL